MESLLRDARYSVAALLKKPSYSLSILFALAIGIGANSAIFNIVNAVLLDPLPGGDADRVVVINQAMARQFWPGEDPLGKRIKLVSEARAREIVGVVSEVKHWGLDRESQPETYVPYLQTPWPLSTLVIRSAADLPALVGGLRQRARQIDHYLPLYDVKTMEQRLAESVAPRRFNMMLFSLFAAIALVLAAVGVFGVMSYSVTQRTHEIGIRMALGAQRGDVLRLVVSEAMALALFGVAAGLVGAYVLSRLVESLLYGISATDPAVFLLISLLLILVALVACCIPMRRATKVDPIITLRYE